MISLMLEIFENDASITQLQPIPEFAILAQHLQKAELTIKVAIVLVRPWPKYVGNEIAVSHNFFSCFGFSTGSP